MTVQHSRGAYDVRCMTLDEALVDLPERSIFITDDNVFKIYGSRLQDCQCIQFPQGEGSKNIRQVEELLGMLSKRGANRSTTIVAFGGGVVGDLAGFVAAIYMRGVQLLQIPTTLLAQVDSSVGGKVGVDLAEGKNLAGAFWPPCEVRVPIDALQTLDVRHFKNGLAEVYKYGLALDSKFFEALERHAVTPDDSGIGELVERCIGIKARIVAEDEFEFSGLRATLNFGHTVGHAIEVTTAYGPILHGEAIAAGMIVEAMIGEALGITELGTADRIRSAFSNLLVPRAEIWCKEPSVLVAAMRRDKKNVGGDLAFSLLEHVGSCKLVQVVNERTVLEVLNSL